MIADLAANATDTSIASALLQGYPPSKYRGVSFEFFAELVRMARRLGVTPWMLANLIRAESRFDPQAQNGDALGLIQFRSSTRDRLGVSATELRGMNAIQQLPLVEKYLSDYAPFANVQEFYVAVFRPADRKNDPNAEFPASSWQANPWSGGTQKTWRDAKGVTRTGRYIVTPADYVRFIQSASTFTEDGRWRATGLPAAGKPSIGPAIEPAPAPAKPLRAKAGTPWIPYELRAPDPGTIGIGTWLILGMFAAGVVLGTRRGLGYR